MKYDTERTRRAVQFLVDSPYFQHHIVKLRSAMRRPRALPFKGDAEPLNELVVIGRQSADALENLIEVAESKRTNRNDYQRDYMAKKRQRERHAVELEEAKAGRSFDLEQRIKVIRHYAREWNIRKENYLAAYGELPWMERNRVVKDFWMMIDAELVECIGEVANHRPRSDERWGQGFSGKTDCPPARTHHRTH